MDYQSSIAGKARLIPFPINQKSPPKCSICKTRPATKLCDFPISRDRYIGHPPRYLMQQSQSSTYTFKEVQMQWTVTCDKPLCDRCAIYMNKGIDFCPTHIQEMLARKKRK